jgi:hypothetical protein
MAPGDQTLGPRLLARVAVACSFEPFSETAVLEAPSAALEGRQRGTTVRDTPAGTPRPGGMPGMDLKLHGKHVLVTGWSRTWSCRFSLLLPPTVGHSVAGDIRRRVPRTGNSPFPDALYG